MKSSTFRGANCGGRQVSAESVAAAIAHLYVGHHAASCDHPGNGTDRLEFLEGDAL